jgi:hypothetical protein
MTVDQLDRTAQVARLFPEKPEDAAAVKAGESAKIKALEGRLANAEAAAARWERHFDELKAIVPFICNAGESPFKKFADAMLALNRHPSPATSKELKI